MNKNEFMNQYNLTQETFNSEYTRKKVSKKELATLKALCNTSTIGLSLDIDDTVNADAVNADIDYKLAHRGNAKQGTLISIWSRNAMTHATKKADYRDFGVRLHKETFATFFATDAFKELVADKNVQVFSHKDGYEVRYSFKSLADAVKFVFDIADAVKELTKETASDETTKETASTVESVS